MTIAALLDVGADADYLIAEIGKLNLQGFELKIFRMKRSEINAVKFEVQIQHQPHYHTHLGDIFKIIDSSSLSDLVKTNSEKIFETIGVAESKIHNIPLNQIHFHEVGAIDSIVDIVGTCICVENLGIEKIYTTRVKLGRGLIDTQHGLMPNPAPATLEILKDYPVEFTEMNYELTTPTGAAIVKTLSNGIYDKTSVNNIKKIGYGSGTFDIKESPNLLRVILCEGIEETNESDDLLQIETNIDDMNPQIYPYVMEKLFEAGARDVYFHDITMKKGRPGILLSVLVDAVTLDKAVEIIYNETTTLGVRINKIGRHKLHREIKEFQTSLGKIDAKLITRNSSIRVIPEFEDCKKLAIKLNKPVYSIYELLLGELNK